MFNRSAGLANISRVDLRRSRLDLQTGVEAIGLRRSGLRRFTRGAYRFDRLLLGRLSFYITTVWGRIDELIGAMVELLCPEPCPNSFPFVPLARLLYAFALQWTARS